MTERTLYLDCFSGAAGNMLLGALLDLGVPEQVVLDALAALPLDDVELRSERVRRGAFSARWLEFHGPERSTEERRFREIAELLEKSRLSERVKEQSLRTFEALAVAEGRVHGIDPGQVHFHEVGAVDAIGDIVGVCAALEQLRVGRVHASALPLGSGRTRSAHGTIPIPAPATLELLRGVPTYPSGVELEMVTPTGAALLKTLVDEFGPMPAMVPEAQGFGAGNDRAGQPMPNVLRAILAQADPHFESDRVVALETNIDDMNPEQLPYLLERLLADGALDAWLVPIAMKKGRPGQMLRLLAKPEDRDRLARRVLTESSALGVRFEELRRLKRVREAIRVETPFGPIAGVLVETPDGGRSFRAEFEDCARAARDAGVPIEDVYRAAERASGAGDEEGDES
jgi:uncharacterized protein (TIGR00299 family) protein